SASTFKVAVDTGSAYTWVGAQQHNPYVLGFASVATGVIANMEYDDNRITFRGETYNDTIGLGALLVHQQGIGVPTVVRNFPAGIDGVLGLGPTRLTTGVGSDGRLIPTILDNLYSQGVISSPLLGVYFMPENVDNSGLLSFGHIQETVLTSAVSYVPATNTFPARYFWGIDASITYGGNVPILESASGYLDTGEPMINIASDAFHVYMQATGGVLHSSGMLFIEQDRYDGLQTLSILIGDHSYDLSPNAQILPRSSSNSAICLIVRSSGSGSNIGFILGIPFLYVFSHFFRRLVLSPCLYSQRYYVAFNSASNEIGFASHIHTNSITN
ncbi:hypothetical protein ID866_10589, partial [Astraeus odoratus]